MVEASRLINKASDQIQAVKPLDVDSFEELKDRAVVCDGLEYDHISSFAAIRQAKENKLGRKLTPSVSATLGLSKNDRKGYQQCKAGKCGNTGDEGGHLIASIFNGPGEKLNFVPMDGNLNKGVWKSMETTWAKALKDGKQVDAKIEPVYSGNNKRPDSFSVTYSVDGGRPFIKDISNTPGGVK